MSVRAPGLGAEGAEEEKRGEVQGAWSLTRVEFCMQSRTRKDVIAGLRLPCGQHSSRPLGPDPVA